MWKASSAANRLVTNMTRMISTAAVPRNRSAAVKTRPDGSAPAAPATSPLPKASTIAQLAIAYTTPITSTAA
ncbi:Uncharacterised protein [Mycobacteroides abscessus subsp. abscessus]|nr:Uncharacterised protein [Mycobacteroides abscessus subsp. abscessus]